MARPSALAVWLGATLLLALFASGVMAEGGSTTPGSDRGSSGNATAPQGSPTGAHPGPNGTGAHGNISSHENESSTGSETSYADANPRFGHEPVSNESGGSSREDTQPGPHLGTFQIPASFDILRSALVRNVSGEYVSFSWDAYGLYNYSVAGAALFSLEANSNATSLPKMTTTMNNPAAPSASLEGAQISLTIGALEVRAHDNPTANLQGECAGTCWMVLAPGVTANRTSNDSLTLSWSSYSARVFSDGPVKYANGTIRAQDRIEFLVARALSSYDPIRDQITNAAANRTIGAEISVANGSKDDVSTFGNVTARILARPNVNGSHGLSIFVVGTPQDGRVIVVDVDGKSMPTSNLSNLLVQLDGSPLPVAPNLTALLAGVTNATGSYRIVYDVGSGSFQVLVALPHYSAHEIDIQSIVEQAPPEVWAGIVAGAFAIVGSALLLFGRRRAA
ncbi:MAG: hypothetical protein ACYDDF_13100 [Thermoplasmatota archaeon]